MKKILWLILLGILLLTGCTLNDADEASLITLDCLGLEGPLNASQNAYQITDHSPFDAFSIAIKVEKLEQHTTQNGKYGLYLFDQVYPLVKNPFDDQIVETHIQKALSQSNYQKALIMHYPGENTSEAFKCSRDQIEIAYVIINKEPGENGTTLYQIERNTYFSMKNVQAYAIDGEGKFINPSYITSSEGLTYALGTFISVRNVSPDSSISGTLQFIKTLPNHDDLLEQVYPNQVRIEDGKIVVYPPQFLQDWLEAYEIYLYTVANNPEFYQYDLSVTISNPQTAYLEINTQGEPTQPATLAVQESASQGQIGVNGHYESLTISAHDANGNQIGEAIDISLNGLYPYQLVQWTDPDPAAVLFGIWATEFEINLKSPQVKKLKFSSEGFNDNIQPVELGHNQLIAAFNLAGGNGPNLVTVTALDENDNPIGPVLERTFE